MLRFLIYLFETGLCLSLLYLAYWVFLRKETYFNFNRLFLVGSLALTLIIPLLHLNFLIPQGSSLEHPARDIERFQSAYEEMIRLIDADFGVEPGAKHSIGERNFVPPEVGEEGKIPGESLTGKAEARRFPISNVLLIIYIGGVIYFLARYLYLVIRLYLLARKNKVIRQKGFRMVEIEEDISPFSFFRFLFINNASFNDAELDQVLEHEKAHIRQKHSMDHLFVHLLAVFQWFNPFAWQMRKALKTTHEYIADRQVVIRGTELIDYQALLLKQVIGYHSVELVNNFNLKPIKKRIAMMNKTKSGIPARLKAVLVIPVALIIFFLFADFTLKGMEDEADVYGPDLSGLWIKKTKDDFGKTLYIEGNIFSFSEGLGIREFNLQVGDQALMLSESGGSSQTRLKYVLKDNELNLWWTQNQSSTYVRAPADNTLDYYLTQHGLVLDLPFLSRYRLMENENLLCRVGLGKDKGQGWNLSFNGKKVSLNELAPMIEKEKERVFMLDQNRFTVLFLVDRGTPMSELDRVRQKLRENGSLHIAEGGYPHGDLVLSPLLYHAVGMPRLLPPLDAKVLDKKEVEKNGGHIHTIDLSARNSTPLDVDEGLTRFIGDHRDGKYVISLEYDGNIPYGQYVETVDMIFNTVYRFRDELSRQKYQLPYDQLGDDLQREMRKAFPMALSESLN